jgi:CrcB protein
MMRWFLVGLGAAFGAMLRLALAQHWNTPSSVIPLGTLLANVLGGFLMGGLMGAASVLTPELRWLLATGFLGGLTTFSTFSAETFTLLQTGRWGWALMLALVHVSAALLATAIGWGLVHVVQGGGAWS